MSCLLVWSNMKRNNSVGLVKISRGELNESHLDKVGNIKLSVVFSLQNTGVVSTAERTVSNHVEQTCNQSATWEEGKREICSHNIFIAHEVRPCYMMLVLSRTMPLNWLIFVTAGELAWLCILRPGHVWEPAAADPPFSGWWSRCSFCCHGPCLCHWPLQRGRGWTGKGLHQI